MSTFGRPLPLWVRVLGAIALYYPFSIGLTFYQKWMLKDLKFPLSMVLCHYIIKFIGVALLRVLYRGRNSPNNVVLCWPEYASRLAPIGAASSLDICLSNWALEYITVSLYTMAKSTCIIFILIFAVCLHMERLRVRTFAVIGLVVLGFVLFTYNSPQVDYLGLALVELAALCAGLRWALSQYMMQAYTQYSLKHPLDMIFHVQPWMILCAIPMVFAFEGHELSLSAKVFRYSDIHIPLHFLMYVIIGGLIAMCMELSEYLLLVTTSGVTLNICGIVKELVTLVFSHLLMGDQFTLLNVVGLSICIAGVCLHVALKALSTTSAKPSLNCSDCGSHKCSPPDSMTDGDDPSSAMTCDHRRSAIRLLNRGVGDDDVGDSSDDEDDVCLDVGGAMHSQHQPLLGRTRKESVD